MTYMRRARRIELAIFPALFVIHFKGIMEDIEEDRVILNQLLSAEEEAYVGLNDEEFKSTRTRVVSIAQAILNKHVKRGGSLFKVFLGIFYAMNQYQEENLLPPIVVGSNFDLAYEAIKEEHLEEEELLEATDKSAQKLAEKIRKELSARGYLKTQETAAVS